MGNVRVFCISLLLTLSRMHTNIHTHTYALNSYLSKGVSGVHERGRVFAMELTMAQTQSTLAFARGSTRDFDAWVAS